MLSQMARSHFLWLNDIYSNMHVCVCITISLFIRQSYLNYFYILAIINNAAMNIGLDISFLISISFSLNKYPGVKLLGFMVVLFLTFDEPPYCHSKCLHQFTVLSTVHEYSLFFTILPILVISCLFFFLQ